MSEISEVMQLNSKVYDAVDSIYESHGDKLKLEESFKIFFENLPKMKIEDHVPLFLKIYSKEDKSRVVNGRDHVRITDYIQNYYFKNESKISSEEFSVMQYARTVLVGSYFDKDVTMDSMKRGFISLSRPLSVNDQEFKNFPNVLFTDKEGLNLGIMTIQLETAKSIDLYEPQKSLSREDLGGFIVPIDLTKPLSTLIKDAGELRKMDKKIISFTSAIAILNGMLDQKEDVKKIISCAQLASVYVNNLDDSLRLEFANHIRDFNNNEKNLVPGKLNNINSIIESAIKYASSNGEKTLLQAFKVNLDRLNDLLTKQKTTDSLNKKAEEVKSGNMTSEDLKNTLESIMPIDFKEFSEILLDKKIKSNDISKIIDGNDSKVLDDFIIVMDMVEKYRDVKKDDISLNI